MKRVEKEKEKKRKGPPECDSRRTISTKPPPRLKRMRRERKRESLTTGLIFDFDQAAKIGSIVSRGVGAWPSQMNRNRIESEPLGLPNEISPPRFVRRLDSSSSGNLETCVCAVGNREVGYGVREVIGCVRLGTSATTLTR